MFFSADFSNFRFCLFLQDPDSKDATDWDRYAAEEYELLVAEEQANEQQDL